MPSTWFASVVASLPPGTVPCRKGCSACCHGPFDISPSDAERVSLAVRALPGAVRSGVFARAEAHVQQLGELVGGWQRPWDTDQLDEDRFDEACDGMAHVGCPALDTDGSCLIHEARPVTCRMTGLGMVTLEGDELENVCPIQDQFPTYRALPLFPFDLSKFEEATEQRDEAATGRGYVTTTVAGAILHTQDRHK